MLRYGISIRAGKGAKNERVHFIDWKYPENNHFAVAEEVPSKGIMTNGRILCLYVNGIAVGVIELKRSKVS
ncbi:MAG: type I restriction endonuclease [Fodinibius sp.]|nr:type I restriction endonuclease [Fodinibius sp.]